MAEEATMAGEGGSADGRDGIGEPDAPPAKAQLKILGGRHSGALMPLPRGRYRLGQDEECDFIFLDDAFLDGRLVLDVTGDVPWVEADGRVRALVGGAPLAGQGQPLGFHQAVEVGDTRFALVPVRDILTEEEHEHGRGSGVDANADKPASVPAADEDAPGPAGTGNPAPASRLGNAAAAAAALWRRRPPMRSSRGILLLALILGAAAASIAIGFRHLRPESDPRADLAAILARGAFAEVRIDTAAPRPVLTGFVDTEARRAELRERVKGIHPPIELRIVTGEEIRAALEDVQNLYRTAFPVEIVGGGTAILRGVSDDGRLNRDVLESARQAVPAGVEVESIILPAPAVMPFLNEQLDSARLAHKVRLEGRGGRVSGTLVKGQMDSAEMAAWRGIQAAFRDRFSMDLGEEWTRTLSPTLARFLAANRELDAELLAVAAGELGHLSMRDGRKYFEGARLKTGPQVRSIRPDRIVLELGGAEHTYFLKKGSR